MLTGTTSILTHLTYSVDCKALRAKGKRSSAATHVDYGERVSTLRYQQAGRLVLSTTSTNHVAVPAPLQSLVEIVEPLAA